MKRQFLQRPRRRPAIDLPALRIESGVNQTTYAAAAAAWRPWANFSTIFLLNAGMSPGFRLEPGFLN